LKIKSYGTTENYENQFELKTLRVFEFVENLANKILSLKFDKKSFREIRCYEFNAVY